MFLWDNPIAIAVADVVRFGFLFAGLCFAAATVRLLRDPWVQRHPTWRGFRARVLAIALGAIVVVLLQYERINQPVHLILLPLSVLFFAVALYSVWVPISDLRFITEKKLREL